MATLHWKVPGNGLAPPPHNPTLHRRLLFLVPCSLFAAQPLIFPFLVSFGLHVGLWRDPVCGQAAFLQHPRPSRCPARNGRRIGTALWPRNLEESGKLGMRSSVPAARPACPSAPLSPPPTKASASVPSPKHDLRALCDPPSQPLPGAPATSSAYPIMECKGVQDTCAPFGSSKTALRAQTLFKTRP